MEKKIIVVLAFLLMFHIASANLGYGEKQGFGYGYEEKSSVTYNITSSSGNGSGGFGDVFINDTGDNATGNYNFSGALYIDGTNKRLGIGTTNPNWPLHIKSNVPYLYFEDTDGGSKWRVGGYGGNYFTFYEDGTSKGERLVIKEGGNVGIGTASPVTILDVRGSEIRLTKSSNDAFVTSKTTGAGAYFRANSGNDGYFGLELYQGTTPKWYIGSYGSARFDITRGSKAGTDKYLSILTTGEVGIGTTSPTSKLHIYDGSNNAYLRLETAKTDGSSAVYYKGDTNLWSAGLQGTLGNSFKIADETNGKVAFMIEPQTTGSAYAFTIKSDGDVGIGTTTPNAKLEVNGSINATGRLYVSQYANILGSISGYSLTATGGSGASYGPVYADSVRMYADNGINQSLISADDVSGAVHIHSYNKPTVYIGSSTSPNNITLYSPDGTEWTCGVDNSGNFKCS